MSASTLCWGKGRAQRLDVVVNIEEQRHSATFHICVNFLWLSQTWGLRTADMRGCDNPCLWYLHLKNWYKKDCEVGVSMSSILRPCTKEQNVSSWEDSLVKIKCLAHKHEVPSTHMKKVDILASAVILMQERCSR